MDVDNAADTVSPADVTAAENSTDANGDKGDIMSDKILKNVSGQDGAGDENSKDTVISNDSEESAVQPTSSENLFDQLKSVDDNAKAVVSDKPVGEIDAADESDNYEDDAAVDCAEDSASNDKCEDVGKVKAIVDTGANDETMEVDESVNDDNGDVDDTTEENKTSDMDSSKNDTMEVDKSFDNSLVAPEVVEYNEDNTEVEKQQTETNDIMCMENIVDVDTSVLNNTDDASGVNVNNGANEETTLDENQEVDDEEQPDEAVGEEGADEEVSLLPDTERNPTDAEKERVFASDASTNQAASSTDATTSELVESESNENESQTNDDPSNLIEICELQDATVTNVKCVECEKNLPSRFHIDGEDIAEQRNMCSEICAQNFMEKHSNKYTVRFNVIKIALILDHVETCKICEAKKICRFRFKYSSCDSEYVYLCGDACAVTFVASQAKNRFEIDRSLYFIEDVNAAKVPNLKKRCLQCLEEKECSYYCTKSPTDKDYENDYNDSSFLFICADDCLNLLLKEQPDRLEVKNKTISENNVEIGEVAAEPRPVFSRSDVQTRTAQLQRKNSFIRKCMHCRKKVDNVGKNSNDKLYWETMTFCNDICMNIYQAANGKCTVCLEAVKLPNLGKYCVRFGFEMRQFCCLGCLTEFKNGLKLCSYCQKDISTSKDCFLAQLNIDKGGFKDFCTQDCMKKYVELSKTVAKKKRIPGPMADCAVCNNNKLMRVEFFLEGQEYYFCSNPCFSAFKFVNTVFPDPCGTCLKFFERKTTSHYELYIESECIVFCTQLCQLMFVVFNRKIAPCTWCRVKKYNFDMVQKKINNKLMLFCSTNCIRMYHVSLSQMHKKKQPCDQCKSVRCPEYHMTMSDGTTRSFCTYNCVLVFQAQFADAPLLLEGENNRTVVPTGAAKRFDQKQQVNKQALTPAPAPARKVMPKKQAGPIISQVTSLAPTLALVDPTLDKGTRSTRAAKRTFPTPNYKRSLPAFNNDDSHDYEDYSSPAIEPPPSPPPPPPKAPTPPPREIIKTRTEIVTQIVTVPPLPKQVRNVSVGVQPLQKTKGVTAAPETKSVECQTDDFLEKRYFVPIPVPMYMPMPMHMYSLPCPIPVPIPLPIPVPVFIPTTRNSANGIMKEIKKIQDKMPADPFEAELLMMAEMVAGEPKKCESDSSDEEEQTYEVEHHHHHQQQHVAPIHTQHQHQSANNSYVGEDVLQMALNQMADEYGQPIATNSVDLETAMQANTITPNTSGMEDHHGEHMYLIASPTISGRGRKRGGRSIKNEPKRERRDDHQISLAIQHHHQQMEEVEAVPMSTEKPDANMCLKFTFGVNAWKQWVMTKNSDIEKSSIRVKPFKNDLLSLTGDELNFSLCLFVQEVRKPNGSEYAPDTIYYLVLGIQQYLYENGRVDNIFTDTFYDKFTECLDDVAKRFSVLYNDSQYIVTRVEEEHLWECKQLGAHSPHVLLSTLMFFNTKHFNLTSVDEHMQLSFSHIMKHWKRNPNQPGSGKLGNTRNVLLRFYPPQSAIEGNSRKKKVYEQQENEENPLRCPVKLYEFYLSKCPESVKPRNDVFYLQPERSCVPDSPVWYSTQALGRDQLSKMLHRVKMVKEINIALLSS